MIGEKVSKNTNNLGEVELYKIEYEDTDEFEEIPASWVVPLYANDIEGVFDLRQAYRDCDINIIDLKF